jgi:hypothetical protein
LGIEYQGQQHYIPIELWGGEEGLKDLRARDAKKRELCNARGVKLLEIRYDEQLNEEALLLRLRESLS